MRAGYADRIAEEGQQAPAKSLLSSGSLWAKPEREIGRPIDQVLQTQDADVENRANIIDNTVLNTNGIGTQHWQC